MNKKSLKPLPNVGSNKCFGCSENNKSGLKMNFFADDSRDIVVSFTEIPPHLSGWSNLAHGGIIGTVLDEIMSWTVIYRMKRFMLTKSITVDYLKPVFVDSKLKAEGRISLIKSEREIEAEGFLFNEDDELLARSRALFALFSMDAARKMGLMSNDLLNEFESVLFSGK